MLINSIDIKRPPIISKTTPININQNSISQPKNMGVLSFEGFLPFFSKPNNINKESLFVQKSYTHIPNSENEKSSRKNDLNFDIKNIVRSIRDEYANFDLEAKQSTKQLHKLINYGKKYNYKGSIPWGYNTNLTFPDYKDNKVKTIIVWKNGSPHEIFEINSLKPKPDYELTMYAGTSTLTYTIKDGQITS
ncbi:hypothetical protein IJ670_03140, partial [bacterium]|nr:hypothetical protein [bacterium]